MTFSNRIPLAGTIPVLVVLALAAMMAVIAFGSTQRASAAPTNDACGISPDILDMLIARYDDVDANDCDTLDLFDGGTDGPDAEGLTRNEDHALDTWDFSGQDLPSFAISDDDAEALTLLNAERTGTAAPTAAQLDASQVVEKSVKYIDLTGNPLTIDDVSLANIPSNVALKISVDSNVSGFQTDAVTITEDKPAYIGIAIPDQRDDDDVSLVTLSAALEGGATDDLPSGVTGLLLTSNTYSTLINLGSTVTSPLSAVRTFDLNSESDGVVFYFVVNAGKDNDNDEDWNFDIALADNDSNTINGTNGNLDDDSNYVNQEIEITVLDADAPTNDENSRSEDVVAAIEAAVVAPADSGTFGGHTDFDELTLRDLGAIPSLIIRDSDPNYDNAGMPDDNQEPLTDLLAGDFEGLTGLTSLSLIGANALPSGIFAGVGYDDGTLEITFAKNARGDDEDIQEVGNFKPSTLPSHIFDDQEKHQVIILDDDLDDDDKRTTTGLDAAIYAAEDGGHFFVMTSATTRYYKLGSSVILDSNSTVDSPSTGQTFIDDSTKVLRFAVTVEDDDKARTEWVFLFNAESPTDVRNLVDIAVVEITDAS